MPTSRRHPHHVPPALGERTPDERRIPDVMAGGESYGVPGVIGGEPARREPLTGITYRVAPNLELGGLALGLAVAVVDGVQDQRTELVRVTDLENRVGVYADDEEAQELRSRQPEGDFRAKLPDELWGPFMKALMAGEFVGIDPIVIGIDN